MSADTGRAFPDPARAEAIQSPCIGVCAMDWDRDICTGCGRTLEEIGDWAVMSADERREIMAELPERLSERPGGRNA